MFKHEAIYSSYKYINFQFFYKNKNKKKGKKKRGSK